METIYERKSRKSLREKHEMTKYEVNDKKIKKYKKRES